MTLTITIHSVADGGFEKVISWRVNGVPSENIIYFDHDSGQFSLVDESFFHQTPNKFHVSDETTISSLEDMRLVNNVYLVAALSLDLAESLRMAISEFTGIGEYEINTFAKRFYPGNSAFKCFNSYEPTYQDELFSDDGQDYIEDLIAKAKTNAIVKATRCVNMTEMAENWGEWT